MNFLPHRFIEVSVPSQGVSSHDCLIRFWKCSEGVAVFHLTVSYNNANRMPGTV